MEQPPVGVMPKRKNRWGTLILAVFVLFAAALVSYYWFSTTRLANQLPERSSLISFSDTGVMERFLLSHFSLLAPPREHAGDAVILESVELPGSAGKAVLASIPETPGTVLGILHTNGNFEPILSDGTPKVDLHVIKGGLAVYAVLLNPVVWQTGQPKSGTAADTETDTDILEGHATGPVDSGADYSSAPAVRLSSSGSMLFTFDLEHGTVPHNLGPGKNPRITGDGSLIAISPEGIVKVDAETGARSVMFSYKGGDAVGSTISEDGSVALLHSEGNSVSDVYVISSGKVSPTGSIVSLLPNYGASFADSTHIFLRTAWDAIALYRLPDDTASLKPPTARLSIIAPQ